MRNAEKELSPWSFPGRVQRPTTIQPPRARGRAESPRPRRRQEIRQRRGHDAPRVREKRGASQHRAAPLQERGEDGRQAAPHREGGRQAPDVEGSDPPFHRRAQDAKEKKPIEERQAVGETRDAGHAREARGEGPRHPASVRCPVAREIRGRAGREQHRSRDPGEPRGRQGPIHQGTRDAHGGLRARERRAV